MRIFKVILVVQVWVYVKVMGKVVGIREPGGGELKVKVQGGRRGEGVG